MHKLVYVNYNLYIRLRQAGTYEQNDESPLPTCQARSFGCSHTRLRLRWLQLNWVLDLITGSKGKGMGMAIGFSFKSHGFTEIAIGRVCAAASRDAA
jgi:hypothetical protein